MITQPVNALCCFVTEKQYFIAETTLLLNSLSKSLYDRVLLRLSSNSNANYTFSYRNVFGGGGGVVHNLASNTQNNIDVGLSMILYSHGFIFPAFRFTWMGYWKQIFPRSICAFTWIWIIEFGHPWGEIRLFSFAWNLLTVFQL